MPDDDKVITRSMHEENLRLWALKKRLLLGTTPDMHRKALKREIYSLEQMIERYRIQNER